MNITVKDQYPIFTKYPNKPYVHSPHLQKDSIHLLQNHHSEKVGLIFPPETTSFSPSSLNNTAMPSSITSSNIPVWVIPLISGLKMFTFCIRCNRCLRYYRRTKGAFYPFRDERALNAPRAQSAVNSLRSILRLVSAYRQVEPSMGLLLMLTPTPTQKQNLSPSLDTLTRLPLTFLSPMKISFTHLQLTPFSPFVPYFKYDLTVLAVWLAITIEKYLPSMNYLQTRRVRYMLPGGLLQVFVCCPLPSLCAQQEKAKLRVGVTISLGHSSERIMVVGMRGKCRRMSQCPFSVKEETDAMSLPCLTSWDSYGVSLS